MNHKRMLLIGLTGLLLHGSFACGAGPRDCSGSSTGIRGELVAVAVVVGVAAFVAGVKWANKGVESKSAQIDRALHYQKSLESYRAELDRKQTEINHLQDSLEVEKRKVLGLESQKVTLQARLDGHQAIRLENTHLKRQLQICQDMQRNLKGVFCVGFYAGLFYRTRISNAK